MQPNDDGIQLDSVQNLSQLPIHFWNLCPSLQSLNKIRNKNTVTFILILFTH